MFSQLLRLPKSLVLCFLLQNLGGVVADSPAYLNDQKFENGELGSYPMQNFHTSSLVAPRVNVLSTHSSCEDGSLIMLNPRGHKVPEEGRGPMILDARGNMVWAATGYEQTYDLMMQEYRGKQYLTFWSGNDAVGGHGAGEYVMLDSAYNEVARIKAANNLDADLHEFRFTKDGTALLTVYDVQPADLTQKGGKSKGWIWDSIFQEIDIETGKLKFQWRASQHYTIEDSFKDLEGGYSKKAPYDFFHINSVEKDSKGNYLVSARYTSTLSYIDGRSGRVLWTLGGRRNNFKDLSDGRATDFRFQHDARWHDGETAISIFNNGAYSPIQPDKQPFSRAMKIKLDRNKMTAELETQFISTQEISSSSQGSMQILPNGNVLVGYGYNGAFAEFASNGVAMCETHFGAASSFHTGDVQSYRVMKFNWTGVPNNDPVMAVADGSAYVSWNGATEVHQWALESGEKRTSGGYEEDIRWKVALKVQKAGFETKIDMPEDLSSYVRIVALDRDGKSLGISKVFKTSESYIGGYLTSVHDSDYSPILFLILCMGLISFGLVSSWLLHFARRAWRKQGYALISLDDV